MTGPARGRRADARPGLLLDAGADPDLGSPAAGELARCFELDDDVRWLQRG